MGKRKLQSHPVNIVGFYSSQIMDMSAFNTCGKSVKDRNSIKCNLSLTKVHLKCNYLNYVDSQYFMYFQIKHGIATAAVKICSHLQQ